MFIEALTGGSVVYNLLGKLKKFETKRMGLFSSNELSKVSEFKI